MTRAHRLAAPFLAVLMAIVGMQGVSAGVSTTGHGYWPMFMDGPAHNGDNRDETALSPSTVSGLRNTATFSDWYAFHGEQGGYPVVMGSTAAGLINGSGSGVRLAVFNLPSGSLRWSRFVFGGDPRPASPVPALTTSDVIVGVGNKLDAYNATTGHLRWSRMLPSGSFNAITVSNGVVYADTYDFNTAIVALNATSGALLWSATLPECCSLGAVSVSNGVAYVTAAHLWAFNATSGAHLFTSSAPAELGTPAVSGGIAYAENSTTLQAFNASTGGLLWSAPTTTSNEISSFEPAVDGSIVVVTTPRYVIAFNATSGARLWTYDSGARSGAEYLPPAIANGVVYAGSIFDGLQAFNERSGALLYSRAANCYGSPIVSHGAVYLSCDGPMQVFSL